MIFKNILQISLLLWLAGCSPEQSEKRPERILSLSTAATHILTELGAAPVAIDEYGRIAAGTSEPPIIGRGTAISREKIAEFEIDGIIIWSYQAEAAKHFCDDSLHVTSIPAVRLAEYPELILQLSKLTGKTERGQKLADSFRQNLRRVSTEKRVAPSRVCFELYSPWKVAGDESYLGDLMRAAGGKSIVKRTGLIGVEHIAESAPEVIFYIEGFGDAKEIIARPGISSSPAARNGRIYPVPRRLTVEGLAPLEAIEYLKQRMR